MDFYFIISNKMFKSKRYDQSDNLIIVLIF